MSEPAAQSNAPELHHLPTLRTGRYYTLGAAPQNAKRVWFVLHGYAQLAARLLRHFDGIIPADVMIVAPEGLSRFYLELPRADGGHMNRVGAAWMTREDRDVEIADARGWLDSVYREVMDSITRASGTPAAVTILAFSQGVATAMRWVAGGVAKPRRFISWAGSLATDVDAEEIHARLASTEVLLVAGEADHFATPAARDRIRNEWRALKLQTREITYDGVHELHPATLAELLNLP